MGLFGFGKKKVPVTVHGYHSLLSGKDGRYDKQAKENRKILAKKLKKLPLVSHTVEELCAYIEAAYSVKPLPGDDELVREVREQLPFPEPHELVVYNMQVRQGNEPAAWLEIYIEKSHDYLAYNITELECKDHYSVDKVVRDIVNYFGATKEDKKRNTERYQQYQSVQ